MKTQKEKEICPDCGANSWSKKEVLKCDDCGGVKEGLPSGATPIPQEIITLLRQATPTPWKWDKREQFLIGPDCLDDLSFLGDDDHCVLGVMGSASPSNVNRQLIELAVNFVAQLAKSGAAPRTRDKQHEETGACFVCNTQIKGKPAHIQVFTGRWYCTDECWNEYLKSEWLSQNPSPSPVDQGSKEAEGLIAKELNDLLESMRWDTSYGAGLTMKKAVDALSASASTPRTQGKQSEETDDAPCPCSFCVTGNCSDSVHVYYRDQVKRIANFAALVVNAKVAAQHRENHKETGHRTGAGSATTRSAILSRRQVPLIEEAK